MDGRVHHEVLSTFVRLGRPPSLDELARALAVPPAAAAAALQRLHDGHGLVLHPGGAEVWIAHPFSASPTAVWIAAADVSAGVAAGPVAAGLAAADAGAGPVAAGPVAAGLAAAGAGARGWWAPCMWCASGVIALAAPDATIHARYGGEHEAAVIEVRAVASAGSPTSVSAVAPTVTSASSSDEPVVHFALPPRDAWRNVVHWCSTVLPFRRTEDVDPWCERHGLPRGAVLPWAQVVALGRAWYGRHLDEDWRKHTVAEAQAIFDAVGLTGDFWRLPVSERPF